MTALVIVNPLTITDAMLTSSTVTEDDYSAWSGSTTYALGARVIVLSTHKIYQSLQASNLNKDPTAQPLWWIEVSPTNKWACSGVLVGAGSGAAASMVGGTKALTGALNIVRIYGGTFDSGEINIAYI